MAFLLRCGTCDLASPQGAGSEDTTLLQKVCRIAIVFLSYCGFLYLLKWNPFWEWMLASGFENRNKVEGFLILVSTLVWLIATLRILLRSSRLPTLPAGSDGPVHCAPRQEKARRRFSLTDLALFYFFTRK